MKNENVTRPDFEAILSGDVARIRKIDPRGPEIAIDGVVVEPKDVRRMIGKYLLGELSASELTDWSMFLVFRPEYHGANELFEIELLEGDETPDCEDYYEIMWYVLQRLSTPKIDGEINEERVTQYLKELEKYSD